MDVTRHGQSSRRLVTRVAIVFAFLFVSWTTVQADPSPLSPAESLSRFLVQEALELDQVLLFRIENGLVRHVLALPSDPEAFEAFWA